MTAPARARVLALDTGVAVPLLMRSHQAHSTVVTALSGRDLVLTAHSLAETYSVLTRLPGDARVAPADAAQLIEANFGPALLLAEATVRAVPHRWDSGARNARRALGTAAGRPARVGVAAAVGGSRQVLSSRSARCRVPARSLRVIHADRTARRHQLGHEPRWPEQPNRSSPTVTFHQP
ncbi:MAG: hypothetical protein L0I76_09405 [Pseudonocardia sp.]|nr:hypothetical protein [Pseudonocardia sp.]